MNELSVVKTNQRLERAKGAEPQFQGLAAI